MNARRVKALTSNFLAVVSLLAGGCLDDLPGKPDRSDRPLLPAEQTDFSVLFASNCRGCHGAEGKLGPAPPLNDPLLLEIVPDNVLIDVVTNGRPGTPMPAFAQMQAGNLTDEQIRILAAGLKQHWKSKEPTAADPPAYESETAPTSAERVVRGEQLFARACAGCHGENGAGPPEGGSPGRINDRSLLALMSNQGLRRIIITGRPDLGMPDFQDGSGRESDFKPLTSDEIDDLVALLAHWRSSSSEPNPMP